MTLKRVAMTLKPGVQKSADDWVAETPVATSTAIAEDTPPAIMKRLTIDIPMELHRTLKIKAATEGMKMADLVRRWIETGCA